MITRTIGMFWKVIPPSLRRWMTRRVHATFTISAAGIITNDEGKVLILDHVLRSTASGWGVPGGFISPGEQPDDALRREIAEETGLQLADIRLFRCRTLYRHVEVIMTAKAIGEARIQSREIRELGWFAIDDLPAEMHKGEKDLIRKAIEGEH